MRLLRLIGVGFAVVVLALVVALIGLAVLTARSGDPALWPSAPGEPRVEIFVVSHGYHSGLVLPRETLAEAAGRRGDAALAAVSQRFAGFHWLEIGWGDEGFYRHVPDAASLTVGLAIRALFRPGIRRWSMWWACPAIRGRFSRAPIWSGSNCRAADGRGCSMGWKRASTKATAVPPRRR